MRTGPPTESGVTGSRAGRILATILFLLGLTGLGVAAATQLNTAWSGGFQAGSALTEADCQPADQPIVGRFGAPQFIGTGEQPWGPRNIEFSGISSECIGATYEVAYRTDADWTLLDAPNAKGTVTGPTVVIEMGDTRFKSPAELSIVVYR